MLSNPAHAALDCEKCKQWVYDIETAKPSLRGGKHQRRPPGGTTPCQKCPKGSPERWERELKPTARTLATLDLYRRCKATHGRALTEAEAADPFLQSNFAILDQLFDSHRESNEIRTLHQIFSAARRAKQ